MVATSGPIEHPLSGLSQRIPPANLQAEQALLGALLANNKAYARVADFLRPQHFADPWHARFYAEIQREIERGGIADVVTLRPKFENEVIDTREFVEDGRIVTRSILAPYYLAKLLSSMVGIINAGEYGQVIYDCWLRRQLIDAGELLVNQAFEPLAAEGRTGAEIATDMAGELLQLADPSQASGATTVQDAVMEVLHAAERAAVGDRPTSVPTGLPRLDRMLTPRGFRPPQLIIVGARPAMGKTTLASALALNAARHSGVDPVTGEEVPPGAVLLFSLEMGAQELGELFLASISGVPSDRIVQGQMEQHEWDRLIGARDEFASMPLVIDDRPALTIAQLRMRARSVAARQRLGLIIVDYLQLMTAPPEIAKHGPTAVVSHLSTGLKQLAKELNVPIVCLSQLSRDLERREDKRPMLSDLRQSGSIEQDADVVLFLYRDEYYLERSEPKPKPEESGHDFDARYGTWKASLARVRGKLEVMIAKQRRGPTGTVHLRMDGATSRIWQGEGDGDE